MLLECFLNFQVDNVSFIYLFLKQLEITLQASIRTRWGNGRQSKIEAPETVHVPDSVRCTLFLHFCPGM